MLDVYEMRDGRLSEADSLREGAWIRVYEPTPEELEEVRSFLGVDMDMVDPATDIEERSRMEVDGGCTMILVDVPVRRSKGGREGFSTLPLSITFTDRAVVTVSLERLPLLDSLLSPKSKAQTGPADPERFAMQVLYRVALTYQADLRSIESRRSSIEESTRRSSRREDLFALHDLETDLVYFRTSLGVNRTVFERMSKHAGFVSTTEDLDLMEDVVIENDQAIEMTSTYLQMVRSTRQLVESDMNNSLSGVMRFLTSVTVIIAIPTLIVGFYGMNVDLPGSDYPYSYVVLAVVMLALCLVVIWGLRRWGMWRRRGSWRRP